jgi:hypothetical protein
MVSKRPFQEKKANYEKAFVVELLLGLTKMFSSCFYTLAKIARLS